MREWLSAQRASGYVYHEGGTFSLTPEQSFIFAEPHSVVHLIGAFDTAAAMVENQPKVQAAFKTGRGVAWGDQAGGKRIVEVVRFGGFNQVRRAAETLLDMVLEAI